MTHSLSELLPLVALVGCATINEDCVGTEDYDVCVAEERAVKKRMEREYGEAISRACKRAGGVLFCSERAGEMDCECADKDSVRGALRWFGSL